MSFRTTHSTLTILTATAFILFAAAYGNVPALGAAATNTTGNITVTVGPLVSVTVAPTVYNFTTVQIGDTNFSQSDALRLVLRNNGSANVSNIYAHPGTLDTETTNPLGTGRAADYAATSFLWIRNNTGAPNTTGFFHAGTLTWNITERAGGIPAGITNDVPDAVAHGFYRNTTGYYLWAMAPDPDTGNCNSPAAAFRMKTTTDADGNRSLSANTTTYVPTATNTDWGQVRATTGPLKGHYIALHTSCEKAYISRFDASQAFPISGNDDQYLFGPANTTVLQPGDEFHGRVGVAVPGGIPAGNTNRTLLTIHVSSVS